MSGARSEISTLVIIYMSSFIYSLVEEVRQLVTMISLTTMYVGLPTLLYTESCMCDGRHMRNSVLQGKGI